ncbi:MAG: hypothetical protein E7158_04865 [Firmicutes bacterium]|nr:hypothetical protein [Bacillota bacterium]
MKNKYQRMSREEKKALIAEYKQTEKGKFLLEKLRNVLISGILLFASSIYLIVTADKVWGYVGAGGLMIIACIFTFASIRLRIKNLNLFAVRGKK